MWRGIIAALRQLGPAEPKSEGNSPRPCPNRPTFRLTTPCLVSSKSPEAGRCAGSRAQSPRSSPGAPRAVAAPAPAPAAATPTLPRGPYGRTRQEALVDGPPARRPVPHPGTRSVAGLGGLTGLFSRRKIDEDFLEELEATLLMADCGVEAATSPRTPRAGSATSSRRPTSCKDAVRGPAEHPYPARKGPSRSRSQAPTSS